MLPSRQQNVSAQVLLPVIIIEAPEALTDHLGGARGVNGGTVPNTCTQLTVGRGTHAAGKHQSITAVWGWPWHHGRVQQVNPHAVSNKVVQHCTFPTTPPPPPTCRSLVSAVTAPRRAAPEPSRALSLLPAAAT
jgi:hypothetical protein